MDLQEILYNSNPWWSKEFKTDFYQRGFYLKKIKQLLSLPHILVISGVRRGGKTTLLMILIEKLIKQGKNPKDIFYFSLDDPLLLAEAGKEKFLDAIFAQYEIIRKKPLDGKVIILIDEIQTIPGWPLWLKRYYDRYKLKFIVTGSSASLIRGKYTELTGRSVNLEVHPFNFKEYCEYKLKFNLPKIEKITFSNCQKLKADLGPNTKQIKIFFEQYLEQGGYPEVVEQKDKEKQKIILTNYYNQIIYRDIVRTFKIKETMILENLALYLLQNIVQKFSFTNIAKTLETNTETVRTFIGYLSSSYLFEVVNFYGTSLKTILKKDKKFYCLDNGLRNAVVGHKGLDKGFLVENLVFNHLKQKFPKVSFWYNQKKEELDFVARDNGFILPVEVKYSDQKLDLEKLRGLASFLETKKEQRGFVLTQDVLEEKIINKKKILFIPVWLFLLV